MLASIDHLDEEPGAGSPDVDHAELPRRGREHRGVAEVRRERLRPCVRLLGGVQVDLGAEVNPSPIAAWRSAGWLDAGRELGGGVVPLHGEAANAGGQLRRAVLLLRERARPRGGA